MTVTLSLTLNITPLVTTSVSLIVTLTVTLTVTPLLLKEFEKRIKYEKIKPNPRTPKRIPPESP
jgi:hypothetical protein